jgi:hypothetical protein
VGLARGLRLSASQPPLRTLEAPSCVHSSASSRAAAREPRRREETKRARKEVFCPSNSADFGQTVFSYVNNFPLRTEPSLTLELSPLSSSSLFFTFSHVHHSPPLPVQDTTTHHHNSQSVYTNGRCECEKGSLRRTAGCAMPTQCDPQRVCPFVHISFFPDARPGVR